jgi:hypothetical protein
MEFDTQRVDSFFQALARAEDVQAASDDADWKQRHPLRRSMTGDMMRREISHSTALRP